MKANWFYVAMVAASVLLVSCHTAKETVSGNDIRGEWNIVEIEGTPVEAQSQPFIGFDVANGRIYGYSGCNRLMGSLNLSGENKIELEQMASTMMACPDMEVERRVLDALASVKSLKNEGNTLVLYGPARKPLMLLQKRFDLVPLSSLKGEWEVVSLYGTALPADMENTPSIDLDIATNRVSGNSGCNRLTGEIRRDEAVENFSDAIQAALMGGDAEGPVYIFGGWAYDAAGTEPVGEVVPHSDEPLQLYAVWLRSANYAMLTFKSNGEGLLVFVPKTGLISADDLAAIRQLFGADSDMYVTADGVTIDISSTPIETDMVLTPAADSGFEFEKLGSGYALTAYSGTQTALEVPAVHEGAPVVAIAEGAFEGNVGIVSVTLPSGVTQIGARAFAGCSSLASVTGGRLRSVASDAFEGTAVGYESQGVIYLNDSLKTVLGCSASASKVNLPASVSAIADGAFAGSNITSFSLAADSALYALPEGAFEGCASLESADLSSAAFATVGGSAFRGCTALTKISLPSSVSSVGAYAFYGCAEVDAISLAGVRTLGEYALAGTAIEDVEWTDMRLTALAEGVFAGCASLKSVVLPTGLRSIGKDAFAGCTSLETVNVNAPDGGRIQSIGEGAFEGCASLERVILFAGLNDDAPAAIAEGAFEGCGEKLVIFVADGSPVYNTGSAWYDPSADGMPSYVAIYSQSYPSLTFMASDLSSPVITCGSSSIMVSANDVTANTDVAALLAANGVSATDNYTPADRIVLSIDELVRISTYGENSEEEGEAVEPDEDGLYDLTGKGVYRVTVRATDLFGNYAYTVVTLAVVL